MDNTFYSKVAEAVENGTGRCLATVVAVEGSAPGKVGFKMLVLADGAIHGTVGGGEAEKKVIDAALSPQSREPRTMRFEMAGRPGDQDGTRMVCGGAMEALLEPLGQPDRLYVFGGGHCGMALGHMARLSGFWVGIYDNRAEWASSEKHPDANALICAPYDEISRHVRHSERTYLVIMTHGHDHDEQVLRQCIDQPHRYLGFIGSRRKVNLFLDKLAAEGRPRETLSRIMAPIGFDIGSETPAEIAVSILAQLIAVRKGLAAVRFSSNPMLSAQTADIANH